MRSDGRPERLGPRTSPPRVAATSLEVECGLPAGTELTPVAARPDEPGVTTARAGGEARSDMRFPQFVQKMIPSGLSHPQLPQRMPPQ